jgi:uncharacterized membrane protein SpoIIM required for sporulation
LILRSALFRKNREKSWERLEILVSRLDQKGVGSLTPEEATELPLLYQSAVSSLALARNIVLDRNLTLYLENLVLRGYIAVYGPRKEFWEVIRNFFSRDFPRSVRYLKWHILIIMGFFAVGLASGFLEVTSNPESFHRFVPMSFTDLRGPTSTAEDLLEDEIFAPWPGFEKSFISFASYIFERNSQVAFLSFGFGFALGIPTVIIIFDNGQALGAMMAIHYQNGITVEFIGWLSIHGVTELLAIFIAGAAGLGVAQKFIFAGRKRRLPNLAREGHTSASAMVGVVFMLLVAGLIEGGFRQLLGSTFLRFFVASLSLFMWLYYFIFFGREDDS